MRGKNYPGVREFPSLGRRRNPARPRTPQIDPSLHLPAAPRLNHEAAARCGTHPEDRKPEALEGFQILIVDDEADARALLRTALESNGAAVTATDRVKSALVLLTSDPAPTRLGVLVSDIAMPERDGFGLVTDLRAWERPRARHTPALALSGQTAATHRSRALECGFDQYLVKPFDVEELVLVIQELAFQTRRTH